MRTEAGEEEAGRNTGDLSQARADASGVRVSAEAKFGVGGPSQREHDHPVSGSSRRGGQDP